MTTGLHLQQPLWEPPSVRLGISGRKSGRNPETPWKCSQSKFRNSRFQYGWPYILQKHGRFDVQRISSLPAGLDPVLCPTRHFHWPTRAGHEIPSKPKYVPTATPWAKHQALALCDICSDNGKPDQARLTWLCSPRLGRSHSAALLPLCIAHRGVQLAP